MLYQEFECDPNLRSLILCYWKFEIPPTQSNAPFPHFILPDASPSLVLFSLPQFHVQSSSLVGPTKYITERPVHPGTTIVGIRFRPGVISALSGISGLELRDANLSPAPQFIEIDEAALWSQVQDDSQWPLELNKHLLKANLSLSPSEPVIVEMANAILAKKGNLSITELIDSFPKSKRQLQKLFKKEIGLTMKEFAIAMRVRASVIDLEHHKAGYQDTVHGQGYFDQAHFIRDFSKLSKISLPDFKRYIQAIEHRGLAYRS